MAKARRSSGAATATAALKEEGDTGSVDAPDAVAELLGDSVVSVPEGSDDRVSAAATDEEKAADVLSKLKAAEDRIKELELAAEQSAGVGRAIRNEKTPFAGDLGGYRFEIKPTAKTIEKCPHLKPVVVSAIDESEALRWYLANNEEIEGSGRMCDPMHVRLSVKCVDPKRQNVLQNAQRVAYIRQRLESGQSLNPSDEEFLEKFRDQIVR